MKNNMNKIGYVKIASNKNDILYLLNNRRNIEKSRFYDLFDNIFECISKRNYVSIFDFLIDHDSLDLANRFMENCNMSNYNFKNEYVEKSNGDKFLFSYIDKEFDKVNYFISNVYNEILNYENLFLNESFDIEQDFRDYIINYQRIDKINKIKNNITEHKLLEISRNKRVSYNFKNEKINRLIKLTTKKYTVENQSFTWSLVRILKNKFSKYEKKN